MILQHCTGTGSSHPQSTTLLMPLVSSEPVETSDGEGVQEQCHNPECGEFRTRECRMLRSRQRRSFRKGTTGKQRGLSPFLGVRGDQQIRSEGELQKPHDETNNSSKPNLRKPEFELPANRRLYLKASEGYRRRLLEVVLQDEAQEGKIRRSRSS